MTTLTVWKFETPQGAQEALNKLIELSKQHLIQINDAATVAWAAVSYTHLDVYKRQVGSFRLLKATRCSTR